MFIEWLMGLLSHPHRTLIGFKYEHDAMRYAKVLWKIGYAVDVKYVGCRWQVYYDEDYRNLGCD